MGSIFVVFVVVGFGFYFVVSFPWKTSLGVLFNVV